MTSILHKLFDLKNKISSKKTLLAFAVFCVLLAGCKKDETTPTPTPVTPSTAVFKWTPNGGSKVTADSAHYYNSFTTIFAFKNGTANSFEITLSSLAVGTYSISSSTGNSLTFVTASTTYTAQSGTVFITTSNGSKLSGTFNAALSGGTLTSVSGEFTDLPGRN